jgi:hypothetical protein
MRIERIVLVLHARSDALVRPAGEALRDEPPDARLVRRRQQVIRALGAQPVGQGEFIVETLQAPHP